MLMNTQVYVTAPVRETQQAAARPPGGMYRVPPLVDGGNRLKLNVEYREDSIALAWKPAAVSQTDHLSTSFGDHSVVVHG